ncbi:MAG: SH3 domain-containing protein [Verrucomicrobia bacterium]|nr:SH3 domain-containing protein [Leptolyngbya sp. ES-bin-22]
MKFKYGSALMTALVVSFMTVLPAFADTGTLQGSPGSRVNVRQSPSTTAPVRHYGLGGDRVNILNQTNAPDGYRWYFVEFPNSSARGWVRGDLLSVGGTPGGSSTQRVSFAPGTSAATVGGKVQGTQARDYLVNAGAGQTLTTSTVGTSPYLQVQVFDPNYNNLYSGSRNWSGVLRRSGDYRIRVRLVPEKQQSGVTGEYSLTIGVR